MRKLPVLAVLFVTLLLPGRSWAAAVDDDRMSLFNLKGVTVGYRYLQPKCGRLITLRQIIARIENILKRNGIPVRPNLDAGDYLGDLYISLFIKRAANNLYAVYTELDLEQEAQLKGDLWNPGVSTWRKSVLKIIPKKAFAKQVLATIGTLVQKFCDDYKGVKKFMRESRANEKKFFPETR